MSLVPPIGTNYFKLYTVPLSKEVSDGDVLYTLNVNFHVYVTNAQPTDKDFAAHAGKIYIIVVYNGMASADSHPPFSFGLKHDGALSTVKQSPVPGTETKNGSYNLYTIDFEQTMNMFSGSGNQAGTFNARYSKQFSLAGYTMFDDLYPSHGRGLGFEIFDTEAKYVHPPTISGIQVFETTSFEVVKCTIYLDSDYVTVIKHDYDLDFTVDTMKNAVVGGWDGSDAIAPSGKRRREL